MPPHLCRAALFILVINMWLPQDECVDVPELVTLLNRVQRVRVPVRESCEAAWPFHL